jgi:hypothetical protein
VKRSEFQRFLATVADVVRFSIGGITQKGTYVLLLEISSSKLKKVSVRENLATLPYYYTWRSRPDSARRRLSSPENKLDTMSGLTARDMLDAGWRRDLLPS